MSTSPTSVDELFARMGKKVVASVAAHKNDPVGGGFSELPPIDSGVAKLLRCEFYADEGVLKFRAVGGVVAPTVLPGGIPTAGLETSQFAVLPEADPDKGVADVLEVFGKLVGTPKRDQLLASYGAIPAGLNLIAQTLTKALAADPIYFRFSNKFEENTKGRMDPKTGKPFPGRCWQRWQTVLVGYAPPTVSASMPAPSVNGNGVHKTTDEYRNSDGTPKSVVTPTAPVVSADDTYDLDKSETPDVAVLVARAMDNDRQAQNDLESLAGQLGYTPDDVQDAAGWDVIGGWVKNGEMKDGSAAEPATNLSKFPALGVTGSYLPQDLKYPKDATKRNLRPVKVEVVGHGTDGTFTIRSLTDAKKSWAVPAGDPYLTLE